MRRADTRPARRHGERPQGGAALVVAMIMIFMISIMGVSAMRSSTLENQMATNAIQAREVFQEAESATEQALNDTANLTAAFESATGQVTVELNLAHADAIDSAATLTYVGSGIAPNYSIGLFEGLRFIAEGASEADAVNSSASVAQGAVRTVPAN